MNNKDDGETSLVPSRPAAICGAGAAFLATRGLRDLLQPESAGAWCQRAYELWQQGRSNWKEAVATCPRGLEVNPNHAGLQLLMGFVYNIGGGGVAKDNVEAVRWYRKAAEQGNARAQIHLWWIYEHGADGVAKDDAEAAQWYKKAADQGEW